MSVLSKMSSDLLLVIICEGVVVFQIGIVDITYLSGLSAFPNYETFGDFTLFVSQRTAWKCAWL